MGLVDFLERIIPLKSKKGGKTITANIAQQIYFKEIALYTSISYIANAISKCEIKTYENNKEVKDKAYYTMNISPNNNQNSSQFWHKVVEKMYYDGEALVVTIGDKIYCADSYSPDIDPINGNKYLGVSIDGKQYHKTFKSNEVYLFKLDNKKVKEIIDGIYQSYGELIAYSSKSYKKSNGSKYKVRMPILKSGDDEFNDKYEEMLELQLQKFIDSDNAVYTEYEGYELTDMTTKNKAKDISDFISLRKDIFELVAQACNIPLSLLSGNITNVNDIIKSFITFAVDPIAIMMSEELTRKQESNYENNYKVWKQGNYFKVDTSKINHIDILEVAEKVDKLIASGVLCIDNILEILGMDPLNTEFSKTHFITKNYELIDNVLKGEEAVINATNKD